MRLFVALDIDREIRERIDSFIEGIRGLAPNARWVSPESLHVTLKFIGEQPDGRRPEIEKMLQTISGEGFDLRFRGCGFFPNAKAARVFWIGIEAGPALAELAASVDASLAQLGIPKETRAFSPHLTLARAGNRSGAPGRLHGDRPNQVFAGLRDRAEQLSAQEFGTMTAREYFLYQSKLSSQGAKYTKLARFELIRQEP